MKRIAVRRLGVVRGYAFVDNEDAALSERRWQLNRFGYAYRNATIAPKKTRTMFLHQAVMLRSHGFVPKIIDHINRNKRDCTRKNLVSVTSQQSNQNVTSRSISGVRGVVKKGNRWTACVTHNYKNIYIGSFDTKAQAAKASIAARKELGFHGY